MKTSREQRKEWRSRLIELLDSIDGFHGIYTKTIQKVAEIIDILLTDLDERDKACECETYRDWVREGVVVIDEAMDMKFAAFAFCPWCGHPIKKEAHE